MADDAPLRERGETLEEEFFRRHNAELVAKLRGDRSAEETRKEMAAVAGVDDPALIDQLLAHGVTPASFAAMALAPLVAVAWADRKLDSKERAAILEQAANSGLTAGTPEYELLESWLAEPPPPSLMSTWSGYAAAVSASLGAEQRREFKESLLARANAVANAAGGFAGIGRKSPEEQRVLDTIAAAFES